MVYDVYILNRLATTHQSLNKANAALYRQTKRYADIRRGSFVVARAQKPGKRAPSRLVYERVSG
jgi:hypothetical protein